MLQSIFLTCLPLASYVSAHCTREFLKNATDAYLSAQSGNRSATLQLASNFSYKENDNPMDIKMGILKQVLKIDHNLSIYDTNACAAFTELIVTSPKPYVITTRAVFNNYMATSIESIITTNGDWGVQASSAVHVLLFSFWEHDALSVECLGEGMSQRAFKTSLQHSILEMSANSRLPF